MRKICEQGYQLSNYKRLLGNEKLNEAVELGITTSSSSFADLIYCSHNFRITKHLKGQMKCGEKTEDNAKFTKILSEFKSV